MGGTVGMTIRQDDSKVHKMSRWTNGWLRKLKKDKK